MRQIISILSVLISIVILVSCQQEGVLNPNLSQDDPSANAITKPAPNLIGTINCNFTLTPPTFWNGTIEFENGDVYGITFVAAGAPVLKVGMSIIPTLVQDGLPHLKLTEPSGSVLPSRHEAAIIEPLVVFHADQQALFVGPTGNFLRLLIFQHKGFDAAYVLIVFDCGIEHAVVQLIRYGDDDDALPGQCGDYLFVQLGQLLFGVRVE